ncbi:MULTISPECIES: AAA family ATPase [unclassified Xanthobacter]|uniref:AAA family ATPase n=1 Tax=unclassified Xanthobacter TaxID=2623496 RepID=UPI001EDE33D8|nr:MULTISPECIES: AAA family ATPase [unclassified Xanthobacter]
MNRRILISGCSGGGKSTLLAELASRGFSVVEEPGRRIVKQELERNGNALPWIDMVAFARRAIEVAIEDHVAASSQPGWTFFDRGLVDAAAALQHATGGPLQEELIAANRYHERVFLASPWPEIYCADPERRHGFDDAVAEYDRLATLLPMLGYEILILPNVPVRERANFILEHLPVPGSNSLASRKP